MLNNNIKCCRIVRRITEPYKPNDKSLYLFVRIPRTIGLTKSSIIFRFGKANRLRCSLGRFYLGDFGLSGSIMVHHPSLLKNTNRFPCTGKTIFIVLSRQSLQFVLYNYPKAHGPNVYLCGMNPGRQDTWIRN